VRKACAESLVALSESITAEERASKLIPIFEKLVDDVRQHSPRDTTRHGTTRTTTRHLKTHMTHAQTSRWVRSAAFQNLGRFIATFEGRAVTPELLQLYNGMVAPTAATKYGDAEIVNYCAFDFPAVIYTIGRDRWGEVKATYEALVKDLQWKVRRPLAHALHEVAAILGQELTEKDLCPFFELFMKDLDEVLFL
jgi:serine/threonine-protein phosphatase 4 regulatory subunit 1